MDELTLAVELTAVVLAGLGVVWGSIKMFSIIFADLKDHDRRITQQEQFTKETASCLEHTALVVAALEERTKKL